MVEDYLLTLDESTDSSTTAQIATVIRVIDSEFNLLKSSGN
jgi:hypothetical protein